MFIYRNHTIEHLFKKYNPTYSGYGDISVQPSDLNEDVIVWFYELTWSYSYENLINEIKDFKIKISHLFDESTENEVIIIYPDLSFLPKVTLNDFKLELELISFKRLIYNLSDSNSKIKILDLNYFSRNYSKNKFIDWKFYYLSDIIINPKLSVDFFNWFDSKLNSINLKRKKCLVIDCDNTLWGGIVGEDGIDGIKLGNTYPGNAFKDFQSLIVEAHDQGVIITICSKNNERDVIKVFEDHPEMILKLSHISCLKINWNNKAQNIYEISEELNIGLDSMVFIDDNPSERSIVKHKFEAVEVPEFPKSPFLIKSFFDCVLDDFFKLYKLTDEDKSKTRQYQENKIRSSFKKNFSNIDEYLKSINIVIEINKVDQFSFSRVAQMTQKTNQFNLTTIRFSEKEIKDLIQNNHLILTASISDKFGNSGITGLIIIKLKEKNHQAYINSFLLSCRVLGKGIEFAFIKAVLNHLNSKGIKTVNSKYVKTLKNSQTLNFYEDLGFKKISAEKNNESVDYVLELNKEFKIKNFYKIKIN